MIYLKCARWRSLCCVGWKEKTARSCCAAIVKALRVPARNHQTKLGKGRKFDFAHVFMVDRLGHDKNYWIVFSAK